MKRRIWCALTAVMAASLVLGVGMAVASAPKGKVNAITLRCKVSLTTEPPADSNTVNQPTSQGSQYGAIHCAPPATFGGGIEGDSFTVPDSGDTVGSYQQYFGAGSIKGTFDLTPSESSGISVTSFEAQDWTGTLKVTGGTGVYKGIKPAFKGKKGIGTFNCTSPDSVHLTCTEKIKVQLP